MCFKRKSWHSPEQEDYLHSGENKKEEPFNFSLVLDWIQNLHYIVKTKIKE